MNRFRHEQQHRLRGGALLASIAVLVATFASATGASTSKKSAPPPAIAPPRISGVSQEGQILRVDLGKWLRRQTAALSFQWLCRAPLVNAHSPVIR